MHENSNLRIRACTLNCCHKYCIFLSLLRSSNACKLLWAGYYWIWYGVWRAFQALSWNMTDEVSTPRRACNPSAMVCSAPDWINEFHIHQIQAYVWIPQHPTRRWNGLWWRRQSMFLLLIELDAPSQNITKNILPAVYPPKTAAEFVHLIAIHSFKLIWSNA